MAAAKTFIALPRGDLQHLDGSTVVVVGASEASPYSHGTASHAASAPRMLREASAEIALSLAQFDFDLDATMFPERGEFRGMVDCGDVSTNAFDASGNRERIETAVRRILDAGAVPVVLGGDDSVPIAVLEAYERHGPLTIVQIDAHVDWGDVIRNNPFG